MENTIQYFTEDQATSVAGFIKVRYELKREEARKEFFKSSEGKALIKEINESEETKERQADRETLLEDFDRLLPVFNNIKSISDINTAKAVLRIFSKPTNYIKEDYFNWYGNIPVINRSEIKHISHNLVINAIVDGENRNQFDEYLSKRVSDYVRQTARERVYQINCSWDLRKHIDGIIATMPVCDESQALAKVEEKIPYEEINKIRVLKENEFPSNDDIDLSTTESA